MKQTPILYSTPMVQAIQAGIKTKTRRLNGLDEINKNPDDWWVINTWPYTFRGKKQIDKFSVQFNPINDFNAGSKNLKYIECPFGGIGDILWVRETFTILNYYKTENYPHGKCFYKADNPDFSMFEKYEMPKWKPSIFLPKAHCRIWLQIKSIKVERLQSISEQDAIQEGIVRIKAPDNILCYYFYPCNDLRDDSYIEDDPIISFMSLWVSINKWKSWNLNPWVWVIEFEQIEKPII